MASNVFSEEISQDLEKIQHTWKKIVALVSKDPIYSYESSNRKQLEELREELIIILRKILYYHPNLHEAKAEDIYHTFHELLGDVINNDTKSALLQKGVKKQNEEIETLGPEQWFEKLRKDLIDLNHQITKEIVIHSYNADAPTYDGTFDSIFLNSTSNLTKKVLRNFRSLYYGKTILDFGCGSGTNLVNIAKHVKMVVGADISDGLIKKAKEKVENSPHKDRIKLVLADGTKLPFPNNFFDFTLALEYPLGHIAAKYNEALNEMSRSLKTGGYILLDADNADFNYNQKGDYIKYKGKDPKIGSIYEWGLEPDEWSQEDKMKHKDMAFKTFTGYELEKLFNDNHLKIIKIYGLAFSSSILKRHFNEMDDKIGRSKNIFGRFLMKSFWTLDNSVKQIPFLGIERTLS